MNRPRAAVALWLAALAVCAWLAAQARFSADMSAFLPEAATPAQRLLIAELREGVASRLLLVGIEGAPPDALARLSRGLAQRLAGRPEFVYVANGDARLAQADRDFLFAHRYRLSPGVTRERFEAPALAAALERGYEALASPAGVLVRRYLPADPTGELVRVLGAFDGQARPASHDGVWVSGDRRTALLLVQTAARGFDLDAQQRNIAALREAFAAAQGESGAPAELRVSGPAVFAVRSRDAIQHDVRLLSAAAAGLIAALLLVAFRSPRVLALAFVPVASGALAGVAAVALGFGAVHGITLGFGITLIGEAVDYAIYLFGQRRAGEPASASLDRIWPVLRLGMLISAASFCAMLLSGFPGLAQLGLFSVVGLAAALVVTRWVLPHLAAGDAAPAGVERIARLVPRWRLRLRARVAALAAVVAASVVLIWRSAPIWDDDLARLNPVGAAEQALDQRLRAGLGAPDARQLLVVAGASAEQVLEACEALRRPLTELVDAKLITGFDSPAGYLPSRRTQLARQAALPDEATLRARLKTAVAASPFRPDEFEPFVRDVVAAKTAPPLERGHLGNTAFGLKTDALLVERGGQWNALLPLSGVRDADALAERVAKLAGVTLLDIRAESAALLAAYREHALRLWGLGLALIVLLLGAHLRSGARVLRVLAPIAAAVAATVAILLAGGTKLALFHLVALLLVVGVGSNYALFFERAAPTEGERAATAFAVVFCAATTIIAFGLLAVSRIPVLQMIGGTVAIGAAASLVFGALVARGADE